MTTLDIGDKTIKGGKVIEVLSETFAQLFVAPHKGAGALYRKIVENGEEPLGRSLSHFRTDPLDTLEYVDTPAGAVLCVTFHERSDFVTFLQIMGNRCEPATIPDNQGASILDGVINRRKFERGLDYHDVLIVLSAGPYSAIPAEKMGLSEKEWVRRSVIIRKNHECTHFICRRRYPEKKDAVWDELVADAIGIYAAFGRFDPEIEKTFLGIEKDIYVHGRLENYLDDSSDGRKTDEMNRLVEKILKALDGFSRIISGHDGIPALEMVPHLEDAKDSLW